MKKRVKNVLGYKKPMLWVTIAAVLPAVIVALLFLTNPKDEKEGAVDVSSTEFVLESSEAAAAESNGESVPDGTEETALEETASEETTSVPDESDVSEPPLAPEPQPEFKAEPNPDPAPEPAPEPILAPEPQPAPGYPFQKTHQTPEGLVAEDDYDRYYGKKITPGYFQLLDIDRVFVRNGDRGSISTANKDNGHINEAGLKMWVCTEEGEKIDYVYSNSDGLVKFECTEGRYNFLLEGGDYADKYVGTVVCSETYTPLFEWQNRHYALFTYHDVYEDFKVRVVDSKTKQPLAGVEVEVADHIVYTDENGYAVFKPLLHYVDGIGTSFQVDCHLDEYDPVDYQYATLYQTELELEMDKTVVYDIQIKILDAATGEPVSGVYVTNKPNFPKGGIYFEDTVSGEDGILYGSVSSLSLLGNREAIIYFSYDKTYVLRDGTETTKTANGQIRVKKGEKTEFEVTIEFGGYDHRFR